MLPVLFRILNSASELGAWSLRRCPDWVLSGGLRLSPPTPVGARSSFSSLFLKGMRLVKNANPWKKNAFSNGNGNWRRMNGQG